MSPILLHGPPQIVSASQSIPIPSMSPPLHLVGVMRHSEELATILLDPVAFDLQRKFAHRELPHLEHVVEAVTL